MQRHRSYSRSRARSTSDSSRSRNRHTPTSISTSLNIISHVNHNTRHITTSVSSSPSHTSRAVRPQQRTPTRSSMASISTRQTVTSSLMSTSIRPLSIKLTSHSPQTKPSHASIENDEFSDLSDLSESEGETMKVPDNVKYDDFPMTKAAFKRLQSLQTQPGELVGLRTIVDTGGCSGFQYIYEKENIIPEVRSQITPPSPDIDFNSPDHTPVTQLIQHQEDYYFIRDGMASVIDNVSLPFVYGAQLDYRVEMIRSAFAVVNNPNVDLACGCGTSFSKKEKIPPSADV